MVQLRAGANGVGGESNGSMHHVNDVLVGRGVARAVSEPCRLTCCRRSHVAVVLPQPSRVAVAIQNVINLGADEQDE
jgi:hypothetical protein